MPRNQSCERKIAEVDGPVGGDPEPVFCVLECQADGGWRKVSPDFKTRKACGEWWKKQGSKKE